MTVEFGTDANRPYYIGLVNTLIAPGTLGAPILGGILADSLGFSATFIVAALGATITALILVFAVYDPRTQPEFAAAPVVAGHVGD